MHSVPACRATNVTWSVSAQGATQGLMISVGVASKQRCRLPSRPSVQVLIDDRRADATERPFALSSEDIPRRIVGPTASAWALVRFENWCRRSGKLVLRLTLGGVSVVRTVGSWTPVCQDHVAPPRLGVSLFVRR